MLRQSDNMVVIATFIVTLMFCFAIDNEELICTLAIINRHILLMSYSVEELIIYRKSLLMNVLLKKGTV